jgi:hypothetical protein
MLWVQTSALQNIKMKEKYTWDVNFEWKNAENKLFSDLFASYKVVHFCSPLSFFKGESLQAPPY